MMEPSISDQEESELHQPLLEQPLWINPDVDTVVTNFYWGDPSGEFLSRLQAVAPDLLGKIKVLEVRHAEGDDYNEFIIYKSSYSRGDRGKPQGDYEGDIRNLFWSFKNLRTLCFTGDSIIDYEVIGRHVLENDDLDFIFGYSQEAVNVYVQPYFRWFFMDLVVKFPNELKSSRLPTPRYIRHAEPSLLSIPSP
ncbi:hypothetical protein G7Y89_g13835 [Cudoniella acicularis]|uniref:Uncharacterized protein n=1 Tax=Cudoniella acicularis TaxID=354080 RepID=A0A8H4R7H3_9HELO|nr:hypothetical protein G7Y89_g13835 [Cudoniella acicularis]